MYIYIQCMLLFCKYIIYIYIWKQNMLTVCLYIYMYLCVIMMIMCVCFIYGYCKVDPRPRPDNGRFRNGLHFSISTASLRKQAAATGQSISDTLQQAGLGALNRSARSPQLGTDLVNGKFHGNGTPGNVNVNLSVWRCLKMLLNKGAGDCEPALICFIFVIQYLYMSANCWAILEISIIMQWCHFST